MRIAFYTLGCKVNQYETQALEQLVTQRGHTLVPFDGEADAYVINTCSVTAVSDKKSRQVIRRARKTAPDAILAVCGCYSQTHPDDMDKLEVDLVAGTGDRTGFVDLLEQTWQKHQSITVLDDPFQRRTFENLPAGGLEGRTRAMLKIEDGCVNFCSYCIIPYARGRIRSLPLADCAAQAKSLVEAGYQEIVLTGIEISSWGQDLEGKPSLIDAVEAICQAVPSHIRVRLGSLEPRTITQDFCRRCAALENLCPHFHLSMQSGCDTVLTRMNRKYDSSRYYESVRFLHEVYDRPAITTDLIVGFPGETEDDFEASMAFVTGMRFLKVHVFPYSRREGTAAYDFADQLPEHEKEARSRRMTAAVEEVRAAEAAAMQGRKASVLLETPLSATMFTGYTKQYLPVLVSAPGHKTGDIVEVTLGAWDGKRCRAEIV